jgi:hypothetical protein
MMNLPPTLVGTRKPRSRRGHLPTKVDDADPIQLLKTVTPESPVRSQDYMIFASESIYNPIRTVRITRVMAASELCPSAQAHIMRLQCLSCLA